MMITAGMGAAAMFFSVLIPTIVFVGIAIFIQSMLSKSDNKYLGLILPVFCFLLSVGLVVVFYTLAVVQNEDAAMASSNSSGASSLFIIGAFLVLNIPTLILGVIYYTERKTKRLRLSIEKMKIEDL